MNLVKDTYVELDLAEVQASLEHTIGLTDEQGWSDYCIPIYNRLDLYLNIKAEMVKFLADNIFDHSHKIPIGVVILQEDSFLLTAMAEGEQYFFDIYDSDTVYVSDDEQSTIILQIW
jgi:hypothetical protein